MSPLSCFHSGGDSPDRFSEQKSHDLPQKFSVSSEEDENLT
jgi:hypothetical protein